MAAQALNLHNKLDNTLFNHVSYVANRCLMILKKEGASKDTLVRCGKYLWRLFNVTQTYSHKRRDVTLSELVNIVEDFKSVFGA